MKLTTVRGRLSSLLLATGSRRDPPLALALGAFRVLALGAGCSEGAIVGYDPEAHAYAIKPTLASGERGGEASVPAACVRIADGSVAVVCGLSGAPEHNGKQVHVLGIHSDSGRYEVALPEPGNKQLRLKRANLRV